LATERSRGSLKSQQMGVISRKLITLLLSTSLLVGCTSTTEFDEASSAIQESQGIQAEASPEVDEDGTSPSAAGGSAETPTQTLEMLAEEYPEAWAVELTEIALLLAESSSPTSYPMDLASSPNTELEYSLVVEQRVGNAAKLWGPFFDSDIPMAISVIHPSDKDWFLQRWEELGKDNSGEYWWGKSVGMGGGGGVGWNDTDQIPHMWLMFSDRFKPVNINADFFVHEATHFFQVLAFGDSLGGQVGSCWIGEGSAEFVGLASKYTGKFGSLEEDLTLSLKEYSRFRDSRAEGTLRRYEEKGISVADGLRYDILVMQRSDADCADLTGAMLGYYLGMFVAEKFVIDFGLEALADFFTRLRDQPIPKAFEQATGQGYEAWVLRDVVPYLEDEFIAIP
jgi:outer membrane murein-binding lipoprotein Lpp